MWDWLTAPGVVATFTFVFALGVALAVSRFVDRKRRAEAKHKIEEMIEQARRDVETTKREAELKLKEELLRQRSELEEELSQQRNLLREQERHLDKRENTLEQKLDLLSKKERTLEATQRKMNDRTAELDRRNQELQRILTQQRDLLHRVTSLSPDEARNLLLSKLEQDMRQETGAIVLKHEQELRESCEKKAREIIGVALARFAAEHTAENTVSTVDIPTDDMKGRIIGREGRNIRAFEKATGVDVIVDDTPGIVVVSGFDPVRRETAKLALQKLIQDGRIHPSRIEDVVTQTKKEMEEHIEQVGTAAAQEAGVPDLHEKIISMLGRLRFRTSYSQNVLQHCIEVAYLSSLMAEQLGLNGPLARRCGLLHDIGKAADHEVEGGHPQVGADLLKRYGECAEVVEAARGHHDDLKPENIYTVLVAAADSVSASRPGARRETLEKYIKRLEELEALACGFPGVEQAYAVQAGREVRVMVDSGHVSDAEAAKTCRDIAKAIEEQLTYPGEIKVTLVRETRAVEYAR
jgi:ribonuclease Y